MKPLDFNGIQIIYMESANKIKLMQEGLVAYSVLDCDFKGLALVAVVELRGHRLTKVHHIVMDSLTRDGRSKMTM